MSNCQAEEIPATQDENSEDVDGREDDLPTDADVEMNETEGGEEPDETDPPPDEGEPPTEEGDPQTEEGDEGDPQQSDGNDQPDEDEDPQHDDGEQEGDDGDPQEDDGEHAISNAIEATLDEDGQDGAETEGNDPDGIFAPRRGTRNSPFSPGRPSCLNVARRGKRPLNPGQRTSWRQAQQRAARGRPPPTRRTPIRKIIDSDDSDDGDKEKKEEPKPPIGAVPRSVALRIARAACMSSQKKVNEYKRAVEVLSLRCKQHHSINQKLVIRVNQLQSQLARRDLQLKSLLSNLNTTAVKCKVAEAAMDFIGPLYTSLRDAAIQANVGNASAYFRKWKALEVLQKESRVRQFGDRNVNEILAARMLDTKRDATTGQIISTNKPKRPKHGTEENGVDGDASNSNPNRKLDGVIHIADNPPPQKEYTRVNGYIVCTKCSLHKSFLTPSAYEYHVATKCLMDREECQCLKCNRKFANKIVLTRHEKICVVTNADPVCEYCHIRIRDIRRHQTRANCKEMVKLGLVSTTRHACDRCGQTFTSAKTLKNHKDVGGKRKKRPCSLDNRGGGKCIMCPLCPDNAERFGGAQEDFVRHLVAQHGYTAGIKRCSFANRLDYENWLLALEKDTKCRYAPNQTCSRRPDQKIVVECSMRRCHYWRRATNPDGTPAPIVSGFGILCPAYVFAVYSRNDGSVSVTYCADHAGHTLQLHPDRHPYTINADAFDFMADLLERDPQLTDDEIVLAIRNAGSILGNIVHEYSDSHIRAYIETHLRNPDSRAHDRRKNRIAVHEARKKESSNVLVGDSSANDLFARNDSKRRCSVGDPMCPPGFAPYTPEDMRVVRQLTPRRGEASQPPPMALEERSQPGRFLRMSGQPVDVTQDSHNYDCYGCSACGRHPVRVHKASGKLFYRVRDCPQGARHSLAAGTAPHLVRQDLLGANALHRIAVQFMLNARQMDELRRRMYVIDDATLAMWQQEERDTASKSTHAKNNKSKGADADSGSVATKKSLEKSVKMEKSQQKSVKSTKPASGESVERKSKSLKVNRFS